MEYQHYRTVNVGMCVKWYSLTKGIELEWHNDRESINGPKARLDLRLCLM